MLCLLWVYYFIEFKIFILTYYKFIVFSFYTGRFIFNQFFLDKWANTYCYLNTRILFCFFYIFFLIAFLFLSNGEIIIWILYIFFFIRIFLFGFCLNYLYIYSYKFTFRVIFGKDFLALLKDIIFFFVF